MALIVEEAVGPRGLARALRAVLD